MVLGVDEFILGPGRSNIVGALHAPVNRDLHTSLHPISARTNTMAIAQNMIQEERCDHSSSSVTGPTMEAR